MVHVLQQRHDIEVESLCMITTGYVLVLHYKVLNFIATANDTLILSVLYDKTKVQLLQEIIFVDAPKNLNIWVFRGNDLCGKLYPIIHSDLKPKQEEEMERLGLLRSLVAFSRNHKYYLHI